jgi:hypothetical protein
VQSICTDDFAPAMNAIIDAIADNLGQVCLPRPLVRDSAGEVGCNVVWELPRADEAAGTTPTTCADAPYLEPPDADRPRMTKEGREVCKVLQLPIDARAIANGSEPSGQGWYYDDYSAEMREQCPATSLQRVAFTASARPPTGVVVKLECLDETQSLSDNRTDLLTTVAQPSIGDSCTLEGSADQAAKDALCATQLLPNATDPDGTADGFDRRMFCHPEANVCALSCVSDADCPPAWTCDTHGETKLGRDAIDMSGGDRTMCVNPTCGDTSS